MADKLTIKQERYVQGLFAGLSQREAYMQAYNAEKMQDKIFSPYSIGYNNSGWRCNLKLYE